MGLRGSVIKEQMQYHLKLSALVFMSNARTGAKIEGNNDICSGLASCSFSLWTTG